MSIVIAVIVDNRQGSKEMIFASDGRVLEHGTAKIRKEDLDKVKKLGPKTCLGYAGQSGELFEDVFHELEDCMRKLPLKDLLFVSNKLRQSILHQLGVQRHAEVEKCYGPLNHQFIIGGYYNKKLRLNTFLSSKEFQISKHDLFHSDNVAIEILGSSDYIQKKMMGICEIRLGHAQSFDEVVRNIRYAISKIAEQTNDVNNHVFVRRLSNNFDLESYIGYE